MHSGVWFQVCSSDVAVQRDGVVALAVLSDELWVGKVLQAVGKDVRVGAAPLQRLELHH